MGMNKSKGNMYDFVTHTWNAIKGKCPHDCSYCYMKRWGPLSPTRFDEKELRTDLGSGNFIFVGSSCDMFAKDIPSGWIGRTLAHVMDYDNMYLFQSKNPGRMIGWLQEKSIACTTIETNRWYSEIMMNSPKPAERTIAMGALSCQGIKTFVTVEPVMDFDLHKMVKLIRQCNPEQVNIGADSGNNHLPEPSAEKLQELIIGLKEFTTIHQKRNLGRILI